jgi:hypothetical protein
MRNLPSFPRVIAPKTILRAVLGAILRLVLLLDLGR